MGYSTIKFNYSKTTKTFAAEASNLTNFGERIFQQIYNDSCDKGIVLYSAKTGATSKWIIDDITTNADNEIMYWTLVPTFDTITWHRGLIGHIMIIFND